MKNNLLFILLMLIWFPIISQSQIVGMGITNDNRCFVWKQDGYVSSGSSKKLDKTKNPYRYRLPPNKTYGDIVGMAIAGSNNHIYTWYKNGEVSSGNSSDLDKFRTPYAYSLPAGKTSKDIVGMAILTSNDYVYVWYKDGTFSSGNSSDLDKYQKSKRYKLPNGKRPNDIAGMGIAKNNRVYTWFRDGTVSQGKVADLSFYKAPYPYFYPGQKKFKALPLVLTSTVPIRLKWKNSRSDTRLLGKSGIHAKLNRFTNLLYDATDGQWRVDCFMIYDEKITDKWSRKGEGHIHEEEDKHTPTGHSNGRPDNPKQWHVNKKTSSGTYLMEFLHSWTGLKDEYETKNGSSARCPAKASVSDENDGCVMWKTRDPGNINELCRPETHNPKTEQGQVRHMDCYSWLQKVMKDAGHKRFQVPNKHIPGPISSLETKFVYLTIEQIKQIDSPDHGNNNGDWFANVKVSGLKYPKSKQANGKLVSPRWTYGFGYVYKDNALPRIPITIEIWDEDGSSSADDLCDINPKRGKKSLNLFYDLKTGKISGDISGKKNKRITVKGKGDDPRIEIKFRIDEL